MSFGENTAVNSLLAAGATIVCLAALPLAAYLGLQFLYIDPNPRHMPPKLFGEAVGWAVIGLLSGLVITTVTETLIWHTQENFWARYKGLIIGSVLSLIVAWALGAAFAVTLAGSFTVDAQVITSNELGALAGGSASILGALAGIVAGAILRRFVLSLYRLPSSPKNAQESRRRYLESRQNP